MKMTNATEKRTGKTILNTLMAVGVLQVSLVSTLGAFFLVPEKASAIVGRPATPLSVAGVARRSVYRSAAAGSYAAGVAAGSMVTTLPGGCASVVSGGYAYHQCGGVYYRPVYDGPNVNYVVVDHI